jgi:Carboxypeptidase regulatory-like domain
MYPTRSSIRRVIVAVRVLCAVLLLAIAGTMRAQIAGTGTIQGTISDATGAVIADAKVTITESSTLVSHESKTSGSGIYVFPNIPIGTYTVSVSAPGFRVYVSNGNVLEVGSNIDVDVKMTVGGQEQKVEVQATGLALQTEDASFKQTIDSNQISEMPLNGRRMTDLIQLSGGATNAGGGDFSNGSKYSYASVSISIAGGQGNTTLYRLDGGDNNDYMGNTNLPFPFPDAVAQFSVETAALGAQDGMHSGGLVNVVTRSGTNTYHGSGFWFIRNNYIDAQNFYAVCTPIAPATTCSAKDQLHQNQLGGDIGGKILRDKLFAFVGYGYLESKQLSATTTARVPTQANLLGDFSVTAPPTAALAAASGACQTTATQLIDPATGLALPGNKYNQPGGPTLPAWNAQSLNLIKYLPATGDQNCGVVQFGTPNDVYDKQLITRVDYTINAKNNLYGRYLFDGYQLPSWFFPNNILVTAASGNPLQRVQTFTLGENYTINNNIVNSAHVTILRRLNQRGYNANAINAGTLGVNVYTAIPNGLQLSTSKFTIGGGTNSVAHFNDNTLAFDDEVTMVRGKHQLVFGGEFVRNQLNINNGYESNGQFSFGVSYSEYGPFGSKTNCNSNPNCNTTQIGDSDLDFLSGTMTAFQQSKFQQNALRAPIPSLYLQDTFHATKQLTLVAGLRWSPNYAPVDTKNRGVVFSQSAFMNNQFSTVYPGGPGTFATNVPNGAPAGALYYGDPGVSRGFTKNSLKQFDPNVGVTYDPIGNGKWVLRAGAEYIYDLPNFFTGQRNQQNPPFATAISQSSNGYIPFSTPWLVPASLVSSTTINSNPFPQPQIPVAGSGQLFYKNSQYIVLPAQFHPLRTMQWTASVQHDFPHGWQVQVDYIGNKTSHLQLGLPLNPVLYIPGNWSGAGSCIAPGTTYAIAGTGTGACSTTSSSNYISRSLLTLENPAQGAGYSVGGGGSVLIGDGGWANYNGLVTSVNHRLSSTFSFLGNWTYSKCLDTADEQGDLAATNVQNPNNPAGDYGPCGFDYKHIENFVLVAKSNFPIGNGIVKAAVNNWEFAPLMHIQTGAPFTVTLGVDNSYIDVNNDRASLIPGNSPYAKVPHFYSAQGASNRQYLNLAAFATSNPTGTFGTTGRNAFRAPPAFQMDAQISRIFPVWEMVNMTLRLEAFNMLNHPNFGTPTTSRASGTFGQIGATNLTNARVFQGAVKFTF